MSHAQPGSMLPAVAVLLLLGALLPTGAMADDDGWAPTVATTNVSKLAKAPNTPPMSKAEHALRGLPPMPPMPRPKPAVAKKVPAAAVDLAKDASTAAPAQPQPQPGAPTAPAGDIVTGAIDAVESTRMLSPVDTARLAPQDAPPGALITGAVDTPGSDLARGYCVNIASAAADARVALQRAKLAEAERQISNRIAVLEAKSAEYKAWVERRDMFLTRATDSLVKIYTQMEPDSAALQLVAMDEETAAALLARLEPGSASAILNEMAPERAARLAAGIAGAARVLPRGPGFPPSSVPRPAARGQAPAQGNPGEGRS